MAGYGDFMISQWLTEYVLVPLSLVVLGRKRVPKAGIFWKTVLAKTEQRDMSIQLKQDTPSPPADRKIRVRRKGKTSGEAIK